MALPIAFCCWRHSATAWGRRIGLAACLLAPVGIYLAHTRSAILAGALGIVIYVSLRALTRAGFNGLRLAIVLVLAFGVIAAAALSGSGRVMDLVKGRTAAEVGSSYARVVMMQRGMVALEKSPIVGSGPGTAVYKIGQLQAGAGLTIDNQFLSELLDTGVPGLLLYLAALGMPLLRIFRQNLLPENHAWLCAFTAGLVAYIAIRPILSLTGNQDLAMLFIATIYLLSGRTEAGKPLICDETSPTPERR